MELVALRKPFDREDGFARDILDGGAAGDDAFSVHENGARAAAALAAAVFGPGELEFLAEHIQKSSAGIGGDRFFLAVDGEFNWVHVPPGGGGGILPCEGIGTLLMQPQ